MRRRAALRAFAGLGTGSIASRTVAASATTGGRSSPTGSPTETPPPPTARPAGYEPIGRLPLDGAKETVVGAAGRYAFVAVTDGFAIVDLSDPASPVVVHENREVVADREDGPLRKVFDVKVDEDLLAVVGPANPVRGEDFQGLVTFDVSDPEAPQRVVVHETAFFNHNCDVADGVAYLCGNGESGNPLVTVDARTGEELGRWSITEEEPGWSEVNFVNWPLHDVAVQDGRAFLAQWDAGTWILDVSDPAAPTFLAHVRGGDPDRYASLSNSAAVREAIQPPGNDHFAVPSDDGSLFALSVESWDADPDTPEGGPGSVYMFDNTDPAAPELAAEIQAPPTSDPTQSGVWTTSHNLEIRDDALFTSWYRGGVRVHDVSDPANPTELAAWRDTARTEFWTAQFATNEFFVAPSRRDPRIDGMDEHAGAALYTFPNPAHETPTPSPTDSRTAAEPTGTAGTGQGMGAMSALAALGATAWAAWRQREE